MSIKARVSRNKSSLSTERKEEKEEEEEDAAP